MIFGIRERTSQEVEYDPEMAVVGRLWKEFFEQGHINRIPKQMQLDKMFRIHTNFESDESGTFDLVVGKSVHESAILPHYLVRHEIPKATYLRFRIKDDDADSIPEAWQAVEQYFSEHPDLKRRFDTDFEMHQADKKTDIYISVEP